MHTKALQELSKRILASIHGDAASLIFDRSAKSVQAWLKGPNGKASSETLEKILFDSLSDTPVIKAQQALDDYAFILKPDSLSEVIKAFDECGSVEVLILLDSKGSKVRLRKLDSNLPPQEANQAAPSPAVQVIERPEEPKPQEAEPIIKRSVMICIPANKDIDPTSNKAIVSQFRMADFLFGYKNVKYEQAVNWDLDDARNVLAHKFMESGLEWSFWMDSDMVAPTGNGPWFREIAESNGVKCNYDPKFLAKPAIEQLTGGPHRLVSAVYSTREKSRRLVSANGMQSKGLDDDSFVANLRSSGPRPGFHPTRWFGFGCCAVHRDVFLEIQKACPELAPTKKGEPWLYFERRRSEGEDLAFCRHAIQAGVTPMIDTSVFALHIGKAAFRL